MKDEEISAEARKYGRAIADLIELNDPCRYRIQAAEEDGFRQGVKWAQQALWVKCSERLPSSDEEVLVFYKHRCTHDGQIYDMVEQGRYSDVLDHWIQLQGENVTHWMPLPTAPKEEPKE